MKAFDTHLEVEDRPAMNLLGLLMEGLIRHNLAGRLRRRLAARMRGDLRVQAGNMVVTLRLQRGRITILSGARPGARAWVKGSLGDMLDLLTLTRLVAPIAWRRVRFGGNLVWLFSVLPLLIPDTVVRDRARKLVLRGRLLQGGTRSS